MHTVVSDVGRPEPHNAIVWFGLFYHHGGPSCYVVVVSFSAEQGARLLLHFWARRCRHAIFMLRRTLWSLCNVSVCMENVWILWFTNARISPVYDYAGCVGALNAYSVFMFVCPQSAEQQDVFCCCVYVCGCAVDDVFRMQLLYVDFILCMLFVVAMVVLRLGRGEWKRGVQIYGACLLYGIIDWWI